MGQYFDHRRLPVTESSFLVLDRRGQVVVLVIRSADPVLVTIRLAEFAGHRDLAIHARDTLFVLRILGVRSIVYFERVAMGARTIFS